MNVTQTSLLFFYGIFWAACLGAISDFIPFDTTGWFMKDKWRTSIRRFIACFIIASFLPIIGLFLLYNSRLMCIQTSAGIFVSAIASWSVFSIPRVIHAVILNKCSGKWFYVDSEIKKIGNKKRLHPRKPDPFHWHLIPGLIYVVVPVGIAWMIYYGIVLLTNC